MGTALANAFTIQAGRGSSLDRAARFAPIVANGRVYTIDTLGAVRAFDAQTGAQCSGQARRRTTRATKMSLYGGGIAYDNGRIFATNGLGYVAALDEADRRHPLAGPPRRAAAGSPDRR